MKSLKLEMDRDRRGEGKKNKNERHIRHRRLLPINTSGDMNLFLALSSLLLSLISRERGRDSLLLLLFASSLYCRSTFTKRTLPETGQYDRDEDKERLEVHSEKERDELHGCEKEKSIFFSSISVFLLFLPLFFFYIRFMHLSKAISCLLEFTMEGEEKESEKERKSEPKVRKRRASFVFVSLCFMVVYYLPKSVSQMKKKEGTKREGTCFVSGMPSLTKD